MSLYEIEKAAQAELAKLGLTGFRLYAAADVERIRNENAKWGAWWENSRSLREHDAETR
jgi:hypothetical protein